MRLKTYLGISPVLHGKKFNYKIISIKVLVNILVYLSYLGIYFDN